MIATLIILWVVASLTFFGSLAFMASRPLPSLSDASFQPEDEKPQWQSVDHEPDLTTSTAAVG